jgi:hypothetical protein
MAFMFGFPVGFIWTMVFADRLDMLPPPIKNWTTYATEAFGVVVVAAALESVSMLTTIYLFGGMVSAGIGMFAFKKLEEIWNN